MMERNSPTSGMSKDGRQDSTSSRPETPSTLARQSVTSQLGRSDSKRSSTGYKMQAPRPIGDVVNDAFQDSPARNHIDPEMIKMISAQVTEQVLKNLTQRKEAGTDSIGQLNQPIPVSPASATLGSPDSIPDRFTPPSPIPPLSARGTASPEAELPLSDVGSQVSGRSRASTRSADLGSEDETLRPTASKTDSSSTIRPRPSLDTETASQGKENGATTSPAQKRSSRVGSKLADQAYDTSSATRTGGTGEASDIVETALERAWQPLFVLGSPTARLSAFLRGLALHLIDDYEPKDSLVVTPTKMLRFFNETRVEQELYPWHTIFSRLTPRSLATVYRKLVCPHHLVQRSEQEEPNVPGLTPRGFEYFITCLIQAHPDTEFERLTKALTDMPISSADDRSFRFPKELSRRLLPAEPNVQAQQRLVSSMHHEPSLVAELRDKVAMPPPPSSVPPVAAMPAVGSFTERQRMPYAHSSSSFEDEELTTSAAPERKRKPYSAKEGMGKSYPPEDIRPPMSQYKAEPSGARTSRANSGIPPQGMYPPPTGPSEPVNIPQRSQPRPSTSQAGPPPSFPSSHPRPVRGRSSPPPRSTYTTSDPLNVGSMPDQQFTSNLYPTQSSPNHMSGPWSDFDQRGPPPPPQHRSDRPSNFGASTPGPANIDTSGPGSRTYPPPPIRSNPPSGSPYEYSLGSMGGPVGDPPSGTSHPGRRSMQVPPPPPNERRRSNHPSTDEAYPPYLDSINGNGGYPPPPSSGPNGSGKTSSQAGQFGSQPQY